MASLNALTLSDYPSTVSATYECSVLNSWNEEHFPFEYPKDGGVLSPPVLVSHNKKYKMWKPFSYATEGVEDIAEVSKRVTFSENILIIQSILILNEISS